MSIQQIFFSEKIVRKEIGLDKYTKIFEAIKKEGGYPYIVGGYVRDLAMRHLCECKDIDIEVHGMDLNKLEGVLSLFGIVDEVGKNFGVLKIHGDEADWSVPRRDNKIGIGHKGFKINCDPHMGLYEACKRRDLTINAMFYDPFEKKIIDLLDGLADIYNKKLRAANPNAFLEDSLRALRVVQFISRFGFKPDNTLTELCKKANLKDLPAERIYIEIIKLLKGAFIKDAMEFFIVTNLIEFFPEIFAMKGCPQEPDFHPEGDVLTHTVMTMAEMIKLNDDIVMMMSALCHDMGKPETTEVINSIIHSYEHEPHGAEVARLFLEKLNAPKDVVDKVSMLTLYHLAPHHFIVNNAGKSAYRRLARKLATVGLIISDVEIIARADHFGRTTKEALNKIFPAGDKFLENAKDIKVVNSAPTDVVMGRHLIAKGMTPSIEFGKILNKCREIQFETGITEPNKILKLAGY
jgi:tRNA nucleotidyltransferase (CCA-adding enzyme)